MRGEPNYEVIWRGVLDPIHTSARPDVTLGLPCSSQEEIISMLYLATDHRGLRLKNQLKNWLIAKKIAFKDLGAYEYLPDDDYPDYAKLLCDNVLGSGKSSNITETENRGVIFCGSGAGVCIACNKIKDIRSAIGFNYQQVESFTAHDHVNILAIAADHTSKFKCFQLVKSFLGTENKNDTKYINRLKKIE